MLFCRRRTCQHGSVDVINLCLIINGPSFKFNREGLKLKEDDQKDVSGYAEESFLSESFFEFYLFSFSEKITLLRRTSSDLLIFNLKTSSFIGNQNYPSRSAQTLCNFWPLISLSRLFIEKMVSWRSTHCGVHNKPPPENSQLLGQLSSYKNLN